MYGCLGPLEFWAVVLTVRWAAFYVDVNTIPDVDLDVGPSWAGLLPIGGNENET